MRRSCSLLVIIVCGTLVISAALIGDAKLRAQNSDAKALADEACDSLSFQLEIAGQAAGIYQECHGLGSSNDVEETVIQTPAGVAVRQKTAGVLEWHNITLRRTEPSEADVWSWRKAMEEGDMNNAVKDGAITLWRATPSVEPLARWAFRSGWVAALSFDGSTEEMTIVHEGLERTDIVPSGKTPR